MDAESLFNSDEIESVDNKKGMNSKWAEAFVDFGPDLLFGDASLQSATPQLCRVDATEKTVEGIHRQLRGLVQQYVPYLPGVYGILDPLNRLVYVGKSKALRGRLLSYFLPGNADEKAGQILKQARSIVWEVQPSEFAALLREQSLIRTWQPTLNVVGMPNRSQPAYLNLGRGPAESFYVTRQWDTRASICRGPFYGSTKLFRAVEILNRYFLLRDCSSKTPMLFSDQRSLFDIPSRAGCLRAELGNCLAPCVTESLRSTYAVQEGIAKEWMRGESTAIYDTVLQQMASASERLHFERAARLQEDAAILKWLQNKLNQMQKASIGPPMIYWVANGGGARFPKQGILYLLRSGGVEYAMAAVAKPVGKAIDKHKVKESQRLQRTTEQWLVSSLQVDLRYCRSHESLGVVTTWFHKNKALRKNCLQIDRGDLSVLGERLLLFADGLSTSGE